MTVVRPDLEAIKARLAEAPAGPLSRDPVGNRLLIDLRHLLAYVEELEPVPFAPMPASLEL